MILFDLIKKKKNTFFIFGLFVFFSIPLNAQQKVNPGHQPDTAHLRVGMAGTSPFIFKHSNGQFSGIALEIWQQIASRANWNSNYSDYESVSMALDSLENGKLDVVIGPISITAQRAGKVQFSQPYYQSSLSIMSRIDKKGLFERIAPFLSYRLMIAILIFLFILFIVGTLIWLAERKVSPEQFPPEPAPGIANGMWLAIVTMSTTGYGDRAPVTFWGRIIAGSWMVISIIFATTMVAGIASTLTLTGMETSAITNISQVSGKKVATIQNSPAGNFVKKYTAKQISVNDLETAFQKLKDKEVVAIVYDRPQLLYFLKQHPEAGIQVGKEEYFKQGYGFAFPKKSNLTSRTNVILLNLMEQNRIMPITNEWLGDE